MPTTPIRITVGHRTLTGELDDSLATRELVKRIPICMLMLNRYGREMTFRMGAGALPTDRLRTDGFAVGDLVYWPPLGSFVILYRQDGERFERQHLGHVDGDLSVFDGGGDMAVVLGLAR